jgi:hypothetical protein
MLARAPSAPGKTRLTSDLEEQRARELRQALLLDTAAVVRAADLPLVIAFTPDDSEAEMRRLLTDVRLVPQRGEDLGERMRLAMNAEFDMGAASVVLIGSDLPTLPPERLGDAGEMLGSGADIVVGPTDDGGFCLVAARAPLPPALFAGIEWSTATVFERFVANAHGCALTAGVLPGCWDVDAPEDLSRVLADPRPHVAPHVRAWARAG